MNRVKQVAKNKNISTTDLAEKMGISLQAFNIRMRRSPKLTTFQEVAEILKCDIHELIDCGPNYAHFYDPETKEWLGIRKK